MMKFLRISFFILLLQMATLVLTTSCCTEEYFYIWTEIFTSNVDNRGEEPNESTENRLPAIGYAIGVKLIHDIVYQPSILNDLSSNMYATSCSEIYQAEDEILDIRIFTLTDFDESHPARTNLTDYFTAKNRFIPHSKEGEIEHAAAIPAFIESANADADDFVLTDFDLFLLESPSLESEFRFVVELELKNQGVLKDTTENITLY